MLIGLMPHIAEGLKKVLEEGYRKVGDVPEIKASLFGPLGFEDGTSFALVFASAEAGKSFAEHKRRIEVAGKSYDPFQDLSAAVGRPVMLMIECLP